MGEDEGEGGDGDVERPRAVGGSRGNFMSYGIRNDSCEQLVQRTFDAVDVEESCPMIIKIRKQYKYEPKMNG